MSNVCSASAVGSLVGEIAGHPADGGGPSCQLLIVKEGRLVFGAECQEGERRVLRIERNAHSDLIIVGDRGFAVTRQIFEDAQAIARRMMTGETVCFEFGGGGDGEEESYLLPQSCQSPYSLTTRGCSTPHFDPAGDLVAWRNGQKQTLPRSNFSRGKVDGEHWYRVSRANVTAVPTSA